MSGTAELWAQRYQEAVRLWHLMALVVPSSLAARLSPPCVRVKGEVIGRAADVLQDSLGGELMTKIAASSSAAMLALLLAEQGVTQLPDEVLSLASEVWRQENREREEDTRE
jgi:hypothetical protein